MHTDADILVDHRVEGMSQPDRNHSMSIPAFNFSTKLNAIPVL